tara:strand:+ start:160 stop:543 length:384 start_codon:yes stop_codon:yes gene_type:complete
MYKNNLELVQAMIKTAREKQGSSLSDIAKQTTIERSQLYRWMKGSVLSVRSKSVHLVAKGLGYSLSKGINGVQLSPLKQKEEKNVDKVLEKLLKMIDLQEEKIVILTETIEKQIKQIRQLESKNTTK